MKQRELRADRKGQGGAVLIEFAITLPILMVLLAGMFDFAMAFQRYQVITNAAREGVRMAILPGYNETNVQARVAAYLTASGVTETPTTTVQPIQVGTGPSATSGVRVEVQITHTFSFLGPIAGLINATFGSVDLKSASVMRTEIAAGG